MSWTRSIMASLFLIFILILPSSAQAAGPIYTAELNGVVDPSTSMYLKRALNEAERGGAQALILLVNTPGGLVTSAQEITGAFLDSPIPVIAYVSPSGAHATSAGALICLSANLIAMKPGTTLGAAHPVTETGEAAGEKATNVVASFARGIAGRRGRDVQLAEKIVRKSISLTSKEAVQLKLADFEAENIRDLLEKLNNKKVGERILQTRSVPIIPVERTAREKFLNLLANPNIAYLLLLLGFYGILFELSSPGASFPGIVGVISLMFAFYSLSILPINIAGIVLIVLAVILFIVDIKTPTHGILSAGGIISFFLGSFILFDASRAVIQVSLAVIITATVVTTLFFAFAIGAGIRAQWRKVVTGAEGMAGKIGEARSDLDPKGKIFFEGTLWNAISSAPIHIGEPVRVICLEGLILHVEPVHTENVSD